MFRYLHINNNYKDEKRVYVKIIYLILQIFLTYFQLNYLTAIGNELEKLLKDSCCLVNQ